MKRFISICVSLLILWFLYTKIDTQLAIESLKNADLLILGISIIFMIPVVVLSTFRVLWLTPKHQRPTYFEMQRLILLANTLNMILPAKLGDITKAYFLKKHHNLKGSNALAIILVEKAGDMLGLCFLCIFGILVFGDYSPVFMTYLILITFMAIVGLVTLQSRTLGHVGYACLKVLLPNVLLNKIRPFFLGWATTIRYIKRNQYVLTTLLTTSILNSVIHFFGIWIMFLSIYPDLSFVLHSALTPLAVLAGLVPLTFSGIGVRDAALVGLYAQYLPAEISVGFGMLMTLRLLAYAIPGLAYIGKYSTRKKG
jgi:uncharacterized protein (TIRG00374 family)